MSNNSLRDKQYLLDILNAAQIALQYIEGITREQFFQNIQLQDALVRRLEIIGEASRRVSETGRQELPSIDWKQIIGMRNRLIHEYDDIDLFLVWDTAQNDLPILISTLQPIFNEIQDN